MVQGFTTIGDLQLYWNECEQVYLKSASSEHYQALVVPLSNVYSYMLEYQFLAICHLSKNQLSRAWHNISESDNWSDRETSIVRSSDMCKAYISPLHDKEIRHKVELQWQKVDRIADRMEEYRQKDKEERLQQTLKKAARDYKGGKEYNPEPVEGTCQWFYNDSNFTAWRDSAASGVFWVTAGPGCGKSVLARALLSHGHLERTATTVNIGSTATVESSQTTLCYFFFKDDDAQRSSINSALCAILHQLFSQEATGNLIEHALPKFTRDGDLLTEGFLDLWNTLVSCAASHTGGDIICVLDALDECESGDRERFIRQLNLLYADNRSSAAANLKIFITSRPYDDIEQSFKPFCNQTQYFRFDADERYNDISHDISLVIDAEMDSFASEFSMEDRQQIAERLKSRGTNTYLWLHLTLGIILSRPSQYRRRRNLDALLSDIPVQVSDAYEKILSRSADENTAGILLQILLAAARSLTLKEANLALTLAMEDSVIDSHDELEAACWSGDFKTDVKNFCGLLINVYDGRLSFIHLTAREFLTKKAEPSMRSTKWEGRFSDSASLHDLLSRCCMRYLLLSELASSNLPYIDSDVEKYRFLEYAALHWSEHFRAQKQPPSLHSLQQARQLCSTSQPSSQIWAKLYTKKHAMWEMKELLPSCTGLAMASFLGLQPVVEDMLADANVNINERCGGFGSALHIAVAGKQESIVSLLISRKADVHLESERFGTTLDIATMVCRHHGIAKRLVEDGAFSCTSRALATIAMVDWKDLFHTLVTRLVDISTPGAILLASKNPIIMDGGCGSVAMLLNFLDDEHLQDESVLTGATLIALMHHPATGERALHLLVRQSLQHMLFKPGILKSAVMVPGITDILQQHFSRSGAPCAEITQDVLEIITHSYDPATLKLFLEHSPKYSCDVKSLLLIAIKDIYRVHAKVDVLFEFDGASIVEDEQFQATLLDGPPQRGILHIFLKIQPLSTQIFRQLMLVLFNLFDIEFFWKDWRKDSPKDARIAILKRFLDHPDGRDVVDDRLIAEALGSGDAECIQLLLKRRGRNSLVNDESVDERLLTTALEWSSLEVVQLLLKHYDGALMMTEEYLCAAISNQTCSREIMEFLLERHECSQAITSAVVLASMENFDGVLDLLLERYAKDITITAEMLTKVYCASNLEALLQWKREEVAEIAFAAVYMAAGTKHNNETAIRHLLQQCPSCWFENEQMEKLTCAVLKNTVQKESMAELMNKLGRSIMVTERVLTTAAGNKYRSMELLDMLRIFKPADFHMHITQLVVERAAARGDVDLLDYLAKWTNGTLVISDEMYRLAQFRKLCAKRYRQGRQQLEDFWADGPVKDIADVDGKTALHVAVCRGNVKVVKFLLKIAKADVHAVDMKGWTPLHHAADNQDSAIAKLIVKAGADPDRPDLDGETPIAMVELMLEDAKDHDDDDDNFAQNVENLVKLLDILKKHS